MLAPKVYPFSDGYYLAWMFDGVVGYLRLECAVDTKLLTSLWPVLCSIVSAESYYVLYLDHLKRTMCVLRDSISTGSNRPRAGVRNAA